MNESDGSRRPSLTRWLTEKVEGLASGHRRGAAGPAPGMAQQAAEIARLKQEGERIAKELDDVRVTLIGKEAEFKNDLQDLQERNAELLDKIVKLTQRDRELQAKILDAKFDGTGAKDQAKKLDSDLRDLRRSHKAKEKQISQMKSQLLALEKEAAGRPDPAQATAEVEALTKQLQKALAETQALTEERDGLVSRLADAASGASSPLPVEGDARDVGGSVADARGHVATGPATDPLKAMAAGKRSVAARQISESRRRQGDAAQRLLESEDRGFATLPEGFVEALLEAKSARRDPGEHSAARRGGAKRQNKSRSRGRNRSRRSGSGSAAGNR